MSHRAPLAPRTFSNLAATAALGAAMLAAGTGCGAMTAIANPKAVWALGEPAPMAVVLRRGDARRGPRRSTSTG